VDKKKNINAFGLAIILLVVGWLSLHFYAPPAVVGADAPTDIFSAARAETHMVHLASKPHPSGSAEHDRVVDYLKKTLSELGLAVEIQEGTARARDSGRGFSHLGSVRNVIASLEGSENEQAILLMAHYDSIYSAPGAGDNGSAVAALLETARILRSGPKLRHKIIFLFTDAEESNLLGARFFVENHSLAKQIRYVFNFDARGNGGPVLMFESSGADRALISALKRAVPAPFANSLSSEIYDRMRNSTDFTVFKEKGIAGMNFAFIDGVVNYHTALDSLENLSRNSLQHQGDYALGLARYFGASTNLEGTGGVVYFNPIGSVLIQYGTSMVWPLSLLALLLWFVIWRKLKGQEQVGAAKTLKGLVYATLCSALIPFGLSLLWPMLMYAYPQADMEMHGYNSAVFLLVFGLATFLLTGFTVRMIANRIGVPNLTMGALLMPLILLGVISSAMPGATWLLVWPLLASLAALPFLTTHDENHPIWWLAAILSGVVTLFLFLPLVVPVFSAFPASMILYSLLLLGLGQTFLLP